MFPTLTVTTITGETVVEVTSLDLWVAESLQDKSTSEHGTRLIVAYMHAEGKEPKNLAEVKAWARENEVRVVMGTAPDPTQTGPSEG